jgi:hypothetical protein
MLRWSESITSWIALTTTINVTQNLALAQSNETGSFDVQGPLLCPADGWESNDSYDTANAIPNLGTPVGSLFDIAQDEDWFKLQTMSGITYTIETSNLAAGVDTMLEAYDLDGLTLLASDDNGGGGAASRLEWQAAYDGVYFIRVGQAPGSTYGCSATYTLNVATYSATVVLYPGGLNDIALPLDVSATITNAEGLATYIETHGAAPFGSVQQLLQWDAPSQTFRAWSHEFGFGDNFATQTGDYIFLMLTDEAPTSVTFVGTAPAPGSLSFALVPGQPSPDCALNFLSLPLDQAALMDADALSDDIGGVLQALDWDAAAQTFLAWSNEFSFGDNFPTTPGYPYIVCLDDTAPTVWP